MSPSGVHRLRRGIVKRVEGKALVRASLAVSLDGYIAQSDGSVDWLNPFFEGLDIDFGAFMTEFGAVIMGRKTFEHSPMKGGMPYVLTSQSLSDARCFVDIPATVDEIQRSLEGSGKDIWLMGGGSAISAFCAADCLDRLELTMIPVTLGSGVPLFPHGFPDRRWTREGTKEHPNGSVGLVFSVSHR